MEAIVLDRIPLRLEAGDVFRKIRMHESDPDAEQVRRLIAAAQGIGVPKAVYRECYVDSRTEDTVTVGGIVLKSRVLRVNMEQAHRAFAFLATCGAELEAWARSLDDMLEQYWATVLMEMALYQARQYLNARLGEVLPLDKSVVMNPGSLADWPIQQQRPLFNLIGSASDAIGVRLTESLLMTPAKSVSGIRFPTEAHFESCQLCPREGCPGRRAPYDRELYHRKYARSES